MESFAQPYSPARALSSAEVLRFENQGFLHLKQLMSPEMVKRVRGAYERSAQRHIDPKRGSGRSFLDIPFLLDEDPVFQELAVLPALVPYLQGTVGEDVQLVQTCGRLFPPGRTFTAPWHSDLAETLGIALEHSPNFYIKVHFYFEDLRADQGCLAFLPGTHRQPRETERPRPSEIDVEEDAVVIVPRAGDAVLFNTHCMHMCLDNLSQADRRTLIYSYSHFWVKQNPDACPADMSAWENDPVALQMFGVPSDGVGFFDQRLSGERKPGRVDRLRSRLGRKLLGVR